MLWVEGADELELGELELRDAGGCKTNGLWHALGNTSSLRIRANSCMKKLADQRFIFLNMCLYLEHHWNVISHIDVFLPTSKAAFSSTAGETFA